jgi:hypothetical protein
MRIDPINVNGKQVPLAIGDQPAGRRTLTKYIALLGSPDNNTNTLVVTFDVADPASLSRRDVEATIRSITLGQLATLDDRLARVPYTFREVAPFRVVDILGNSVVRLAIPDGASSPEATASGPPPVIAIERAGTSSTPAETAQFAEAVLRGATRVAEFEIVERATVPFAGGDGLYLTATANQLGILQFLRVLPGGRYIALVAYGEKDAVFAQTAAVEEIAGSLELK